MTTKLMTTKQVAELIGRSAETLRWWRHQGSGGPASFKLGRRVVYSETDVNAWIEAQRAKSLVGEGS